MTVHIETKRYKLNFTHFKSKQNGTIFFGGLVISDFRKRNY